MTAIATATNAADGRSRSESHQGIGDVIVTGGSSGLGAAVVDAVIARGGKPIVLDLNPPRVDADFRKVDLADTTLTEEAVRDIIGEIGGIDAVVTAAGIDACGQLADVPTASWERVVAVNLLGTASVVRAALPALEARQGKVVTVASTLGIRALSDATAYCASKFGVVGFTRALAAELAGRVGVTLLIPGGMSTAFFDDRDPQYQPGPDARLNDPANVANAVVFALQQPAGCEVREMLIADSMETSWP